VLDGAVPADAVLDGAVPAGAMLDGAVPAGAMLDGAVRGGAVRGGPGDETAVADRRVRLHTTRPTEAAAALIAWARAAGVRELPDLRIERPTLEEVYLALVDPAASSAASPVASSAASPVASSAASPVASSAH